MWMYEPGFHHTKVSMVDGQFCTVGSANLNARSLSWDYEENAVIIDSCTTKRAGPALRLEQVEKFCAHRREMGSLAHSLAEIPRLVRSSACSFPLTEERL